MLDGLSKNLHTAFKLGHRHKFAGAMGNSDIAGTKDHGFRAESNHAGRLGAEGDGAGWFARALLEQGYQF